MPKLSDHQDKPPQGNELTFFVLAYFGLLAVCWFVGEILARLAEVMA